MSEAAAYAELEGEWYGKPPTPLQRERLQAAWAKLVAVHEGNVEAALRAARLALKLDVEAEYHLLGGHDHDHRETHL